MEFIECGWIEPSDREWASPAFIFPKRRSAIATSSPPGLPRSSDRAAKLVSASNRCAMRFAWWRYMCVHHWTWTSPPTWGCVEYMVLAPGYEDLHEQGIFVALVPQDGGFGGNTLADVDANARTRPSHAPV